MAEDLCQHDMVRFYCALCRPGYAGALAARGKGDPSELRKDLNTEYQAIVKVVSEFDGRLMIVKGWSVTLSLTALGLAFQQQHYAIFALTSATALAFWSVETAMKRHQMQYYPRMRAIEVATTRFNSVYDGNDGVLLSAPLIDWYWGFRGKGVFQPDLPTSRDAANVRRIIRLAPVMSHVCLPHVISVILGLALFALAIFGVPGFEHMVP